jgi:hypothetical protein
MTRKAFRLSPIVLASAAICSFFAAVAPGTAQASATAQEYPRLTARHAGSGTYENRGEKREWTLSEARIVLDDEGRAAIDVSGRDIRLSLRGRITDFNGREHVSISLDTFDGVPTTAKGWISLDRRGGFERIEFDGQVPVRLGVSFRAKGRNLEPPPPPQPPTPPQGMTEEPGVNRRGADYRHFMSDDLHRCQETCKGDTRCRAYSYNLDTRTCFLKSRAPEPSSDREVVSGVKQGWGGGPGGGSGSGGGSQSGLTEERGLDRRGSDYSDFRVRDLIDCQQTCLRDDRCRAYTYNTIDRICFLKDRVNSQQRSSDMVTGYKE